MAKNNVIVTKYNWKLGLKKVGISAAIVIVSGAISVYGNDPRYLALIPLAEGVLNYLKHR